MNERILCVDDDPNILSAYQRSLRKRFQIDIALGGEEALEAVINDGPYGRSSRRYANARHERRGTAHTSA